QKHEDILSYDEIVRLCRCFATLGINKIKLTGGEPLVRKGLANLVRMVKGIDGIKSVTLTTNGILLKDQLPELMEAGLDGVNISLDTLDPNSYERITRSNVLSNVLAGLKEALRYEELNVKINCVPIPGLNKEDILSIAQLAKDSRLSVRFIEMMPIGLGKQYPFYSEDSILEELESIYGQLQICESKLGNGPAHYYSIPGFVGKIGFISAISHKFCDECNRVRLTSDGFLKTCLQYAEGTDLKYIVRATNEDSELEQAIRQTIFRKPKSHQFSECYDSSQEPDKNVMVGISEKDSKHLGDNTCKDTERGEVNAMYEQRQMSCIGG
ncbi:MAG TPA: GTP 3',8-cyclase MoaA, partial [Lachnospiraceae bacterium]|nr:GTP 3',8-cyclase MoaA [Lachnospiraceae bacterium]